MAGQSDPNQSKNDYAILWILGIIMLVGGLIWYFLSEYLKLGFIYFRKLEAQAASFFINSDELTGLIQEIDSNILQHPDPLAAVKGLNYSDITFVSEVVGNYWMYPTIVILVLMGLFMFKNHSSMRWNTKHNMDTLVRQEQKNWPQIAPVVPIDLVDQDINAGPWAMAKNPMQFVKKYKLVKVEKASDAKAVWKATDNYKATVIKDKAYRCFAEQMGPLWPGIDKAPPHVKALFSIFAARLEHDSDAARAYLGELAMNAAKGEMQYARTEEFLKKYGKNKAVARCVERHAYTYTVMASMLELARTDGVMASADFLWLKPVDRNLWYMLNTAGRQTAPAEIGGPWAHWLAEKEMHRALSVPVLDRAIEGLELALAQIIYSPDDDVEEFPTETPDTETPDTAT